MQIVLHQAEKDSQLQQNVSKVEDLKREADQQRQESEQQIKRLREDMALLQVLIVHATYTQEVLPKACMRRLMCQGALV